MPLRLDIKRKLTARSDRVKSVDLHPSEPWMVLSLYSGTVVVWNHQSQSIVKTFELCDLPVRVAKFVARKHWVIAGADDMQIRVFNYNTLERVHMFEAHADYIRCIAVHPSQPYILTSSDDMLIKLWDWDRKWICCQVFEGHTHYVMQIVINPKDNNQFASASLDRTIKVWQLGSKAPNFTLEGHEKGVNCLDYYSGGDKPYLISGADDHMVKIWDYQNKTCVQTLEGHAQNVTCVSFHPELPIILTGSEDGTVRVWHSNTYRLENTLNYGLERVWCICSQSGSNSVALGYDEGSIIIKLGREEPAMSMDSSGKVMWARHSEVQQANLKALGDAEVRDGERLPLGVKDMGSCEIFPQTIQHSPNGRFVVVCGDGEYIIYTAVALRNKSFGTALEFVWAHDSSQYAIREGNNKVKIFKNFKEKKAFKPDFGSEGVFGGFLLGVRSSSGLAFYDWETADLVRRIEITPKHVFWSDSGELVSIATEESFFVLRYMSEKVAAALEKKSDITEDGIEEAFDVLGEVPEVVKTGVWVGDCFIYTSSVNRLNYYVGGEIITVAHLDRTMYLLGYIPKDDRLYLGDKELSVVSFWLLLSVLEYQTAVMRRDFTTADRVLPTIPKEQRPRVAHFLEKQGFKPQALAVTTDAEHKFELALQLGEVKIAYELAQEAESEHKWKQLAELATSKCHFSLAQECLHQAQDYGGLLLLATASGNAPMVGKLAEGADSDGKTNVAFLAYFMQGRLDKCLDLLIRTERLPEAAFLARTYLPSQVSRVVGLWKQSLSRQNQKAAAALADPCSYSNLFPGLQRALVAEQYLQETHVGGRPAADYTVTMPNEDRNVLEESEGFVPKEASEVVAESQTVVPTSAEVSPTQVHNEEVEKVFESALFVTSSKPEEKPAAAQVREEDPGVSLMETNVAKETPESPAPVEPCEDRVVDPAPKMEASIPTEGEETLTASPPPESEEETAEAFKSEELVLAEQIIQISTNVVSPELDLEENSTPEQIVTTEEANNKETDPDSAGDLADVTMETAMIPPAATEDLVLHEEEAKVSAAAILEDRTLVQDDTTSPENVQEVAKEEQLISFESSTFTEAEPEILEQTLARFKLSPRPEPEVEPSPAVDEEEEEEDLGPGALSLGPDAPSLGPDAPSLGPDVLAVAPEVTEEEKVEFKDEDDDEGLDDLDLDNFDLGDFDPADVNLDDDFLDEN
ncbi:unnamed protein product [Knipowitschia caucasica]